MTFRRPAEDRVALFVEQIGTRLPSVIRCKFIHETGKITLERSEVKMITVPISASSPYRSYSDGSKVAKEPLVRASEDHLSPNAQVRVYFTYQLICKFSYDLFFPKLAFKSHLIRSSVFQSYVNFVIT